MSWRTRSPTEQNKYSGNQNLLPPNAAYLASDVLNLQGQAQGADYVLADGLLQRGRDARRPG